MREAEFKQYVYDHPEIYLDRDRSGKGYLCPICDSGNGPKGTGLSTRDRVHYTCWAGCFSNSDLFDIIGLKFNLQSYPEKLKKAAELYGIQLERDRYPGHMTPEEAFSDLGSTKKAPEKIHEAKSRAAEDTAVSYEEYFRQAHQRIGETDYHRGLSQETLDRFNIGYDPEWVHPTTAADPSKKKYPTSRLIIPTSPYSYTARDTKENNAYSKQKVGKGHIFNVKVMWSAGQPVYIVEGEIDAMSIEDVGGTAAALCSTNNVDKLIALLREKRPVQPLILCLDNDDAGKKAYKKLSAALDELSIFYREAPDTLLGDCKDANECLMKDRAAFAERVTQLTAEVADEYQKQREAERSLIRKESAAFAVAPMRKAIASRVKNSFISTGFAGVDEALDGGLYAGFYVVGAISSLGKTTFCLQLADQIAKQGRDVLIFSLEMARDELIAKSISRLTFTQSRQRKTDTRNAKTTRGILTGSAYNRYNQDELDLIDSAFAEYEREIAPHIYITEGIGDIGVEQIRTKVARHTEIMGAAPVVLIDYLQILAPADPRATDKQNTDKSVLELKRLSRDYHIPVIGVSSFNRDSYSAPVGMAAFKESGAIEYSADVLMALQYYGMDYIDGEYDKEKHRNVRIRELIQDYKDAAREGRAQQLQLKILKNRNGNTGAAKLDFYPMFNYYLDRGVDNAPYDPTAKTFDEEAEYDSYTQKEDLTERGTVEFAFLRAEPNIAGAITLGAMADFLGISSKDMKKRIELVGGFCISEAEVVTRTEDSRSSDPDTTQIWTQVKDVQDIPDLSWMN